jgi:hypothetical protein
MAMDTERPGPRGPRETPAALAQNDEEQPPAVAPRRTAGKQAQRPSGLRPVRAQGPSGRAGGLPRDKALIRRLFTEVFLKSRPGIEAALGQCFSSPETVLECLTLLARLEGELP